METQVGCGLHTMQVVDLLSRSVQELENCGQYPDISLLQEIDTDCANFYKSVHRHITQTKAGYDFHRFI